MLPQRRGVHLPWVVHGGVPGGTSDAPGKVMVVIIDDSGWWLFDLFGNFLSLLITVGYSVGVCG